MNKNTQLKKERLLEGLVKSLGVITSACAIANISRTSYYSYYKDDDEFAKEVDEVSNIALDFAESQLHEQIQSNNTTATIFYLKTKGKKRGYIERQEITGAEGMPTNFQIEIIDSIKDKD